MENGYHLYDFKGSLLREEHVDRFKQFSWRPRPPLMLSKEEQKQVRRNLREYSKVFDEADVARKTTANKAQIDNRRRQLEEWLSWREQTTRDLREQRIELGLPPDPEDEMTNGAADGEMESKVVEEIVEEIIKETEEVV